MSSWAISHQTRKKTPVMKSLPHPVISLFKYVLLLGDDAARERKLCFFCIINLFSYDILFGNVAARERRACFFCIIGFFKYDLLFGDEAARERKACFTCIIGPFKYVLWFAVETLQKLIKSVSLNRTCDHFSFWCVMAQHFLYKEVYLSQQKRLTTLNKSFVPLISKFGNSMSSWVLSHQKYFEYRDRWRVSLKALAWNSHIGSGEGSHHRKYK